MSEAAGYDMDYLLVCDRLDKAETKCTALREENRRLREAITVFNDALPKYQKKKLEGHDQPYWSPAGMMVDTELIAALYATLQPATPTRDGGEG